jgi:hypothetical protein
MSAFCRLVVPILLAVLLYATSARAGAQRTFVASTGLDTNPCTVAAPCRSFAFALTQTNAGGEIYVLNSAGYGSVTITQSVSIVNQTSTAGVTATSGNAITINAAATDKIVLRGLTIVGGGTAQNGVIFNTGASLAVEDCTVTQFTDTGIRFQPTVASQLYVSNTRVANIGPGGIGIYVVPSVSSGSVQATLERVEALDDSQAGVFIDGRLSASNVKLYATIADSVLADSTTDGIHAVGNASGVPTFVMLRDSTISNNAFGLSSELNATLAVGHSTISGNGQAFFTSGGAVLESYGDNNVNGNSALGATPTSVAFH